MKIYKKALVPKEVEIYAQCAFASSGRRRLEEKRGKKLICQSCRKEIKGEALVVAFPKEPGPNALVHPSCADKNIPIKYIEKYKDID